MSINKGRKSLGDKSGLIETQIVLTPPSCSAIGDRRSLAGIGIAVSGKHAMTDDNCHRQRHSARRYRQTGGAARRGDQEHQAVGRSVRTRRSRRSTRCCSSTRSSSFATRTISTMPSRSASPIRLGKLVPHPTVGAIKGTSSILELDSGRGGGRADQWHTDVTFVDAYPKISVLRGVVIPPFGGDTVWSNTAAAYLDLPAPLQRLADELWAVHSNAYDYAVKSRATEADRKHFEEVFTANDLRDRASGRSRPSRNRRADAGARQFRAALRRPAEI